jgi:hypothetical protein
MPKCQTPGEPDSPIVLGRYLQQIRKCESRVPVQVGQYRRETRRSPLTFVMHFLRAEGFC